MRTLIQQLENSKYSTIVYVFNNSTKANDEVIVKDEESQRFGDFFGYCDIVASEFSALYHKNIIFWPCPKMKVSEVVTDVSWHRNWFFNSRQIFSMRKMRSTILLSLKFLIGKRVGGRNCFTF